MLARLVMLATNHLLVTHEQLHVMNRKAMSNFGGVVKC